MINIIRLLLIVVSLMTVNSCKNSNDTKMLIADKTIAVYKTYENDQQQIIFYLKPGEQCNVGRKKIAKIYGYYEVNCNGKGHGWVIIGDGYKIIDRK